MQKRPALIEPNHLSLTRWERQKSHDQSLTLSILITLNPPHFSCPPSTLFEEPVILKSGFLGCQVCFCQQQVRCAFQPLGITRRPRYWLLLVPQHCAGAFYRPMCNEAASPCRCGGFLTPSPPPFRRSNVSLRCNVKKQKTKLRSLAQMWLFFLTWC